MAALALLLLVAAPSYAQTSGFSVWLEEVRRDALAAGISQATVDSALTGLTPIERVIELDRKQPEFTQTLWTYLDRSVTTGRIERARRLLAENRPLLDRVQARYGVQPRFLVAFWGLESNFGEHTGGYSVIQALATLAYDARRAAFFRAQLMAALKIIDEGHITAADMSGSWAGAMGQLQFIPTTFANYAVDFDGDRRRAIWRNLPDVFASAANFLGQIGWRGDETWGREVRLPADFDWNQANLKTRKPITEWQRLGVRRADGVDLPVADISGAIVAPMGHSGPAFLVYRNFDAILTWNRSILYAVAVGHLADRIAGSGALVTKRPADERPLRRAEVEEIQTLLATLGFDPGVADGIAGSQTRAALKAFQRQAKFVPDGYPSVAVLEALRRVTAQKANAN
ncbi:MAG: lytic murein transglycosylase [Alphaproteobacteria bacterium]